MTAPAVRTEAAVEVSLPGGAVEVPTVTITPASTRATLVLGHGAGAGKDSPFLTGFANALASEGIATVRFDFPYIVAGRRLPGPASHAIATITAVAADAAETPALWLGGKSYGGRMASMAVAGGLPAAGLVYLGYPLHPPGKPESPRSEHLSRIRVPQLFIEGSKDPFVQPLAQLETVVAGCPDARISWVDGGGHSFEIAGNKRSGEEIGASLAPIVAETMLR